MRDALQGLRRFDQFSQSLGIAPNMLTRRLSALVEAGMLERVPEVGSSSMTGQSPSIATSSSSVTTRSRHACMISSRAGAPPWFR